MGRIFKDFVVEESTTTGTGSLTLSGALTNMRRFRDVCSVNDTMRYIIKGVSGAGVPTGEYEVVEGVYSATDTLTRVTVVASSNAGALVNFSAGTKLVYLGPDATMLSWVREKLTANRTYYIRTDGSDSNDGLANTSGGAFLTVQKAFDVARSLDTNGYDVTAKIADGTYGAANLQAPLTGGGVMIIDGNTLTPANVVVGTVSAYKNSVVHVQNVRINTGSSFCLYAATGGLVTFQNVELSGAAAAHIRAAFGGNVSATGNYAIVGSAPVHWQGIQTGQIGISNRTITITGTPNFSTAFSAADTCGTLELYNNTYSGSATGVRYNATMNGVIQTYTGNTTLLPGNASGSTATGGQYA